MNFTEGAFVWFFLVTYALWWLLRRHDQAQVWFLVVASLVFYAYHQPWLVGLILSYSVVDWAVGVWIARSSWKRLALSVGLTFNLGVLCFWKYTPLLLKTLAWILLNLDLPAPAVPSSWLIPLGISFFSFVGIAYMIDVYRGTIPHEPSLLRFTLFKTFYPQLVAGPILRARDFLPSLQPDTLPQQPEAPLEAALLLGRGFFKKMVLADQIAIAIDPFFTHIAAAPTEGVWALPFVYLYALQIYFDFSGYTDIARGLGLLFGFRWPDNFNLPYLASSVRDFWQRWHISLSQWLRDYLYIPLGGSRCGPWRTRLNLMLTMLLGGLWHGASWTFLLWGGLHGLYLIVHQVWSGTRAGRWLASREGIIGWCWSAFGVLLTFHAVCLAWIFFRLSVLSDALVCVQKCLWCDPQRHFVGGSADRSLWLLIAGYSLLMGAFFGLRRMTPIMEAVRVRAALRGAAWGVAVMLFLLAVLLTPIGQKTPFIYFQF